MKKLKLRLYIEEEVKVRLSKKSTMEDIQKGALKLYGKYDIDKSIVWMAEEFGEVVAAIHKGHSKESIKEELGDLLAWIFCFSNIFDIELIDAMRMTMEKENLRQIKKYGKLKYCEEEIEWDD